MGESGTHVGSVEKVKKNRGIAILVRHKGHSTSWTGGGVTVTTVCTCAPEWKHMYGNNM